MESFHQSYVVIFQTTILRIVGFYVRRSAIDGCIGLQVPDWQQNFICRHCQIHMYFNSHVTILKDIPLSNAWKYIDQLTPPFGPAFWGSFDWPQTVLCVPNFSAVQSRYKSFLNEHSCFHLLFFSAKHSSNILWRSTNWLHFSWKCRFINMTMLHQK